MSPERLVMLMPQKGDEAILHIYRCAACDGLFTRSDGPSGCIAIHPPGSCCHLGETALTENDIAAMLAILKGRLATEGHLWALFSEDEHVHRIYPKGGQSASLADPPV